MSAGKTRRPDPECLALFERLSEYIDGEMSPADCAHLEVHLADCAPCIAFLQSLRQSVAASHEFAAEAHAPPAPPELVSRLKSAWESALAKRDC